jgi:hypothetical protein
MVQVPTGWVTIEEVLRFLITDLDVIPPCDNAWAGKLGASEKEFYVNFTP